MVPEAPAITALPRYHLISRVNPNGGFSIVAVIDSPTRTLPVMVGLLGVDGAIATEASDLTSALLELVFLKVRPTEILVPISSAVRV